jgi:hypothetical protein
MKIFRIILKHPNIIIYGAAQSSAAHVAGAEAVLLYRPPSVYGTNSAIASTPHPSDAPPDAAANATSDAAASGACSRRKKTTK